MKPFLLCGALCACCAVPALAQGRANIPDPNAVFPLPPGVNNVVSIDAQNLLVIESEASGQTPYTTALIEHVYSGGIARLFGGGVVATAQFVSPAFAGVSQTPFGGMTQAGAAPVGGNFGGGFFNDLSARGASTGNSALVAGDGITNLQVRPRWGVWSGR